MASARCSFYGKGERECGESRESSQFIRLVQCTSDVSSHLLNFHLSRKKISEHELILARAGIFDLSEEVVAEMVVCPAHRHSLGKYWRPFRTCQYPSHKGKKTTLHCKSPVNFEMANDIQKMFGRTVQVGSRKLSKDFNF